MGYLLAALFVLVASPALAGNLVKCTTPSGSVVLAMADALPPGCKLAPSSAGTYTPAATAAPTAEADAARAAQRRADAVRAWHRRLAAEADAAAEKARHDAADAADAQAPVRPACVGPNGDPCIPLPPCGGPYQPACSVPLSPSPMPVTPPRRH